MSTMKFATVNEVTLHYTLEGLSQGTPLVFINSLGSDLRIWDDVVPTFLDQYPIIRHDKRGHGLSDCPPAPYSIRNHSEDLVKLLDHLNIDQVIPIGISVGGMIAQDFTINHPDRVKALVLCDTGAKIGTDELWNDRIDALRANGMAYLAEPILERWFAPAFKENDPAAYQGYYNLLTRMPVTGYTGTCEALRDADLREGVKTITAKTLVLCGDEDMSTPPALNQELAESIPNAEFALIEKAGHLPCVEQPAAVAEKINQFLQTL